MILKLAIIVIIIAFNADTIESRTSEPYVCRLDNQFDYVKLVLTWQTGFCRTNRCNIKPDPAFTIHGLWASRHSDHMSPSDCCSGTEPDLERLQQLLPELKDSWESLKWSNQDFWKREFQKHGTCFLKSMNMSGLEYFRKVLKLYNEKKPLEKLKEAGITPSNDSRYDNLSIREAIRRDHSGKNPEIKCRNDVLREISYCFSPNYEPIDCPWAGDCKNEVTIPSS